MIRFVGKRNLVAVPTAGSTRALRAQRRPDLRRTKATGAPKGAKAPVA